MHKQVKHELLVNTRNTLAKRGHTKFTIQDCFGRVCLMGAYWLTVHYRDHPVSQTEFIAALGFSDVQYAVDWNNAPERTEEEVLARLDQAIAETAPEPEDLELKELALA